LLPTDKEVAALLTQITQAGEQAGVTFQLFKPDASKPQEFYNENPVDIKVEGGFHQVGVFLSRLANMSRIVNVTDLHLDGVDQRRADKGKSAPGDMQGRTDHTLVASFTATAYSLRDPTAEPPQGPPAEKPNKQALVSNKTRAKNPLAAAKASLTKPHGGTQEGDQ
jgi:Tfp pilus assembly protein PilO